MTTMLSGSARLTNGVTSRDQHIDRAAAYRGGLIYFRALVEEHCLQALRESITIPVNLQNMIYFVYLLP
jgi:hypothetical protein